MPPEQLVGGSNPPVPVFVIICILVFHFIVYILNYLDIKCDQINFLRNTINPENPIKAIQNEKNGVELSSDSVIGVVVGITTLSIKADVPSLTTPTGGSHTISVASSVIKLK